MVKSKPIVFGTRNAIVTAPAGLNVRSTPGTSGIKVGMLVYGEHIVIFEHCHLSPTEIWGRIERGWIALLYDDQAPYTTCTDFSRLISVLPPEPVVTVGEFPHLYRIKDDNEAGIYPRGTRPYLRVKLPSTVRLRGGASEYIITPKWIDYLKSINSPKAYNYLIKNASGWHNQGPFNLMQQLTFSGNVVEVTRIESGKAFISGYVLTDNPPTKPILPLEKSLHPMVHLFSIQYPMRLDMTTDLRNARTLLLRNLGEEIWIDLGDIVRL